MVDHLVVCVSGQRYRKTQDPPELARALKAASVRLADTLVERVAEAHTLVVISGGANGVDYYIDQAVRDRGAHSAVIDALWNIYQGAAGGYRNGAMLALQPSEWHGIHTDWAAARGTTNCERQAKALGIKTCRWGA